MAFGFLVSVVMMFVIVRFGILALRYLIRWVQIVAVKYRSLAVVLVVIFGVEAVFPSTVLTGLERPVADPPARFSDEIVMPERAFTYGELAESAPWLWRLGTITRPEMERRLREDIATIEARIADGRVINDALVSSFRFRDRSPQTRKVALEGYEAALNGLDALFDEAEIPVVSATAYVRSSLEAAFQARSDAIQARYLAASAAATEAQKSLGQLDQEAQAARRSNPDYIAIIRESDEAREEWLYSLHLSRAVSGDSFGDTLFPPGFSQDTPFPEFSSPIPLVVRSRSVDINMLRDVATGPSPERGLHNHLRMWWAGFAGHRRTAREYTNDISCGIYFADTDGDLKTEYFCEVSQVLRANYDLTGGNCDASIQSGDSMAVLTAFGTQAHEGLCKETWVFPRVNLVVTNDTLSIYPPRPVGAEAGSAPFSQWSVEIDGERVALDRPRTFPYRPGGRQLEELILIHSAKPRIQTPRIWRNFAVDRPGRAIDDAITGAAPPQHAFVPVIYEQPFNATSRQTIEEFFEFGVSSVEGRPPAWEQYRGFGSRYRVVDALSKRLRDDASNRASDLRWQEVNGDFCTLGFASEFALQDRERSNELRSFAEKMPGPQCEIYFAMSQILRQAERISEGGNWLWLFQNI